jgi:hypothetical protein
LLLTVNNTPHVTTHTARRTATDNNEQTTATTNNDNGTVQPTCVAVPDNKHG